MTRPPPWMKPVSLVAVVALLATVPLGFLSSRTGPVPHAALAVVAAIASILVHVRRGRGADLRASLALGLGVVLGIGVPDGVVGPSAHLVFAIAGVALSAWVHLGAMRPLPSAAPRIRG